MDHAHIIPSDEQALNIIESYEATYDASSANLKFGIRRRLMERYCDQSFVMRFCSQNASLFVQVSIDKGQITVCTRYLHGATVPLNTVHSLFQVPPQHQMTHIAQSREDRIIMSSAASLHRVSLGILLRLKQIPSTYYCILDKRIRQRLDKLSSHDETCDSNSLRELADESARALLCLLV